MSARGSRMRARTVGLFLPCLALVVADADAAIFDGAVRDRAAASAAAADGHWSYLPLVARGHDVRVRPPAPTAMPETATPTATATPTQTSTPRPSPTATVFTCAPLPERLRVRSIDVYPSEVKASRGATRATWPIFLAPDPGGDGAHVAWSDTEGRVHVTPLDHYDLPIGQGTTLEGDEVRGLVVHADGVALLIVRGDSLFLVRLDADGSERFEKRLVGGVSQTAVGSKWVDNWGHEARLVWDGERYGVYTGHTQYFGARGKHQGDLLWYFDERGQRVTPSEGWDWGCSHSLDLRLAHNGVRFGGVCLSDSFPSKGFHFHHRERPIRAEPSGDGAGYSAANLGGWVPSDDGFVMSFTSPEGRRSSDVGVVHVGNDATVGPVRWLTDTPEVQESAPHLARYGRRLLVGWWTGTQHLVAVLGEDYAVEEEPTAIDVRIAARDDMVTFAGGDVLWAHSGQDPSTLGIARLEHCDDGGPDAPAYVVPSSSRPES